MLLMLIDAGNYRILWMNAIEIPEMVSWYISKSENITLYTKGVN